MDKGLKPLEEFTADGIGDGSVDLRFRIPEDEDNLIPDFTRHFREDLMPQGGHFMDIGAHFGVFSCYVAKKFGARVTAVEPLYYEGLAENVKLNGLEDQVRVVPLAVSSKPMVLLRRTEIMNSGQASAFFSERFPERACVAAISLSSLLADQAHSGHGLIDYLKMDIEMSEYDVLESPTALYSLRAVPVVQVEFHHQFHGFFRPEDIGDTRARMSRIIKGFECMGYTFEEPELFFDERKIEARKEAEGARRDTEAEAPSPAS